MKKMSSIYPIWSCYVYKKEHSLFGSPAHSHLSCIYVEKAMYIKSHSLLLTDFELPHLFAYI